VFTISTGTRKTSGKLALKACAMWGCMIQKAKAARRKMEKNQN
jgi:hypothetical protein